ncbi:MAG: patatin-like phospholipase family protein [Planctomycetota bacterium]|nr:patatin-like phospholipase family protein [Planctomycetota bacterium]
MRGSNGATNRGGKSKRTRKKLGLVLGGGGSRGMAHLGVLQVFEEEGIPIDMIVGTSIGALIGGPYALNPDVHALQERTLAFLQSDSFRKIGLKRFRKADRPEQNFFESIFLSVRRGLAYTYLLRRSSLFDARVLGGILEDTVPDKTFEDVKIPLAISAVDLIEGEEVAIREGDLRPAILASISLPGFFPPVKSDGKLLSDLGFLGAVPADVAIEMGADVVVSVDVSPQFPPGNGGEQFTTGLEILFRVESIGAKALRQIRLRDSDVIIRPEVGDLYWADFSTAKDMIERGKEATLRALPQIKSLLGKTERKASWREYLASFLTRTELAKG